MWPGRAAGTLRGMVSTPLVLAALLALAAPVVARGAPLPVALPAPAPGPLPQRLADTGLDTLERVPFSPQYPLWSDGATKRRWLHLPAGGAIDASDPDAWQFPPGTRLWKEFRLAGRPVETRYIERLADGQWRFASYVWDADGREARLAPERGVTLALPGAPGGRYEVPSRLDCTACHEGAPAPVLGVGALQLSPARDPLAPHAVPARPDDADLRALVARGWLRGLPPALLALPPRIAAASPAERAAFGYLHANCGHCHHAQGAPVPLVLAQSVADPAGSAARVRASLLGDTERWRPAGAAGDARRVVPGRPEASLLLQRMRSRDPLQQMPPLGTRLADPDGLAAVAAWIHHPLPTGKEPQP